MRLVRQLGPLAAGVALLGAVAWLLLDRGDAIGTWLLAGLLVAHGLIHVMFLVPTPAAATASGTGDGLAWPFDLDGSWVAQRVGPGRVAIVVRTLVAFVVACSVLAALAVVGVAVPSGWWATLVVAAAGGSLVVLGMRAASGLLIGASIDLALIWLVLGSGWAPSG